MPPASTSALAFVTSVRAAMVVLRHHRLPGGGSPLGLLPSFGFRAAPWLFLSITALAAGLALHLVWFVACWQLIPTGRPAARRRGHGGDSGAPRRDSNRTRLVVLVVAMSRTDAV